MYIHIWHPGKHGRILALALYTLWSRDLLEGNFGHDLEPNRIYHEFTAVAKELKNIGSKLVNLKKKNDVAILYSHDSYYGLRFMPYTQWNPIFRLNRMTALRFII
ncbi:MAG: hypothetical protein V8R28_18040 [Bacteroides cellulosilyticus]